MITLFALGRYYCFAFDIHNLHSGCIVSHTCELIVRLIYVIVAFVRVLSSSLERYYEASSVIMAYTHVSLTSPLRLQHTAHSCYMKIFFFLRIVEPQ